MPELGGAKLGALDALLLSKGIAEIKFSWWGIRVLTITHNLDRDEKIRSMANRLRMGCEIVPAGLAYLHNNIPQA